MKASPESDVNNLLDIKALSRSKDLPFIAKTLAQGFLQGSHASIQRGVGVEFSQYRTYEPGDELAKVDWKLFARTDKYFVREAERESDTSLYFIIDSSASMGHCNQYSKQYSKQYGEKPKYQNVLSTFYSKLQQKLVSKAKPESDGDLESELTPELTPELTSELTPELTLSKLHFAKVLSATMAYIAQQQGDSAGCLALSATAPSFVPARNGYKHWQKLLLALHTISARDYFPQLKQMQAPLSFVRGSSLVFIFSDFYQNNDEIYALIKQLRHKYTEIIAVQLESNDERTFAFNNVMRFQDLESSKEVLLATNTVKQTYLANRKEFNQSVSAYFRKEGITQWLVNIDEPIDQTLHQYLLARQRVMSK